MPIFYTARVSAGPIAMETVGIPGLAGRPTVRNEPPSTRAGRAPTDVPTASAPARAAVINTPTTAADMPMAYVTAANATPAAVAPVGIADTPGRTSPTRAAPAPTDVPAPGAAVLAAAAAIAAPSAYIATANAAPAGAATVGIVDAAGRATAQSEPRSTSAGPAPTDLPHVAGAPQQPILEPGQAEQPTSSAQHRPAAAQPPSASKLAAPAATALQDPGQPATVPPTATAATASSIAEADATGAAQAKPSASRGCRRLSDPKQP